MQKKPPEILRWFIHIIDIHIILNSPEGKHEYDDDVIVCSSFFLS